MRSQWIKAEIAQGLQKLQFLALERQPPSASIPRVIEVWAEAVDSHQRWNEGNDRPRLRSAFLELARVRRSWPAPADLLAALARQQAVAEPQRGPRLLDSGAAARAGAEVARLLDVRPEQLRVGKMAAAGPDR